ncbi:hypothetical protein BDV19DRAFT_393820 [Aspergillus venezuelensis]
MDQLELAAAFHARDEESEETSEKWYNIAICPFQRMVTAGLNVEEEKQVQRRFKEVILKTSILYGVSKSLQALLPLFGALDEEPIDHYGPR